MTAAVSAQIGTTDWHLTGISNKGGVCEHCDRNLVHVYTVRNAVTGKTMTVGRACCKKVTGWTLAAAEAARILKAAENRTKRDAAWELFRIEEPELAAIVDAGRERDDKFAHSIRFEIAECSIPSVRARWARQYADSVGR